MKILIISDIHGRSKWVTLKHLISDYDKVIFIGDYVDSFDVSQRDQISNLLTIIAFRLQYPDKVITLLGNHDLSYMYPLIYKCPGYKKEYAKQIQSILREHEDLFQYAVEFDNVLYSHAGVSTSWLDRYNKDDEHLPIDVQVNNIIRRNPMSIEFTQNAGRNFSNTGNDVTQSPIWIRPESLLKAMAHPKQVVGHTQVDVPIQRHSYINEELYLTDSPDYYCTMINGEFQYYKYEN